MSTRKTPIQFRASYCAGEQVLAGAELRELERLLARLVAQAYLADHPQVLTAPPNEETTGAAQPLDVTEQPLYNAESN